MKAKAKPWLSIKKYKEGRKMKKFKAGIISLLICSMLSVTACGGGGKDKTSENITADKFAITVACASEQSEQEVMETLATAFMAKNPEYSIKVEGFSGASFDNYMYQLAADRTNSPNIIWTMDSMHASWHKYFTDLRPFYERDASTDYSLYYESMLDVATLNGEFKPTANYTGSFAREKDTATGLEDYKNHSPYGIYYAPRDYNKPAIICNGHKFKELDDLYESLVPSRPADYVSTTQRLNDIVAGNNWDDLNDLFEFAEFIASRRNETIKLLKDKGDIKTANSWSKYYAIDLKLSWEPTYVTFLTALGVDTLFKADGSLDIERHTAIFEALHEKLYKIDGITNSDAADTDFTNEINFMKIVSRPVLLGTKNRFEAVHNGENALQCIQIPVENIAAGNSGYAINNYYHDKTVTVNGVTKSYDDICWEFIKFIITEEGQNVAGATGHNIPVLKSLRESGEWTEVEGLENMNHFAWVAGGELKQDWYDFYTVESRTGFRNEMTIFFLNFVKSNYGSGDFAKLLQATKTGFDNLNPTGSVRS